MISKIKNLLHPYIILDGYATSHIYPRNGTKKADLYLWLPFGVIINFISNGKIDLKIRRSSSVWFKIGKYHLPEIWKVCLHLDFGKTYCWIGKGTEFRKGRFLGWKRWKLDDIDRKSLK